MNELTQAQPGTVEWEARRVACAFGVEESVFKPYATKAGDFYSLGGWVSSDKGVAFEAKFTVDGHLWSVCIDNPNLDSVQVSRGSIGQEDGWELFAFQEGDFELMARGLYCLGIALVALPPLSAHEQMEARLTMPHEFWPQQWLDEQAKSAAVE